MNKAIIAEKEAVINEISEAIKNSKSLSIVEYRGLTVAKLEGLRRDLRKEGCELKVYKNTLVNKAAQELGYPELEKYLEGPNAFVFSKNDEVAAPKLLVKFAKRNEEVVLKGGIVSGKVIDSNELKVVSTLPNKEGMLSMLLSCLTSPIRGFACAVKAVADKMEAPQN
jgi:large subunit ribosomal protein L10